MKNKIIVAVDGPAGSGKSSVCREAAIALKLKYVDSGAIYRAITLFLLRKHETLSHDVRYVSDLSDLHLEQQFYQDGSCRTFVNGEDVTLKVRDEIIAKNIHKGIPKTE